MPSNVLYSGQGKGVLKARSAGLEGWRRVQCACTLPGPERQVVLSAATYESLFMSRWLLVWWHVSCTWVDPLGFTLFIECDLHSCGQYVLRVNMIRAQPCSLLLICMCVHVVGKSANCARQQPPAGV
jgi:hypothetical protein